MNPEIIFEIIKRLDKRKTLPIVLVSNSVMVATSQGLLKFSVEKGELKIWKY